jgi:hypothetical protein
MHRSIYHIYLCIFTTLIPFAYSSLLLHQRDDGYEFAICHPSVAPGNPLPPCVSVDNQQYSCAPSSNTPSYLQSAQSCICNSSFFQDWVGCRNCLYYHGILNQDWYNAWKAEINSVSLAYCYGTPTAYFPDVFKSMTSAMPSVNTAPIGYFDQAPGNTAVSLYYTAAGGGQGSGPTTSEFRSSIVRELCGVFDEQADIKQR